MNSDMKSKKVCLPKTPSKLKLANTDSLQVFCRLRPMMSLDDVSCVTVISNSLLQLSMPESSVNYRTGILKEVQYSFKHIFTESSTQKEVFDEVALPLVDHLMKGRNGLLFTYGVTGSGKTYSMTGAKQHSGIMPRCLDVLFNSIYDYQAKKFIFKPDKMNGFEVQSEEDALKEREGYLKNSKFNKLRKKESNDDLTSARSKDDVRIPISEEDNAYAVFITYIEIYNNNAYDLLENFEENNICMKSQIKIIREDAARNMYVHGVTEVEVKSAEEAFEVFKKGQKRKKMASTNLNDESSRSHSVFTIRLVQAPLDVSGENVMQDKKVICISQLSLVDLAGSERTNRTKNRDMRLREAGKINNSLMTLRNCLEILRENQQTGINKIIPYRDTKLTHLFKNFFEGEGDIRMIVCINPRKEDYDETVQVMKFAEVSQEITVKPTPIKTELPKGLTPGRRRANIAYKRALQDIDKFKETQLTVPIAYIPNDAGVIYNFEPWPPLENTDPLNGDLNQNLITFLKERIKKKALLRADTESRTSKFRASLLKRESEFLKLKQDNESANAWSESHTKKMKMMENKVVSLDTLVSSLQKKCESSDSSLNLWKKKYEECALENRKLRKKLNFQENELANARVESKDKQTAKELKDKENMEDTGINSELIIPVTKTPVSSPTKVVPHTVAVSNPRYGNRQCNLHDQWLEHRPGYVAPLNTVLQPVLKRRKSFSEVTSPKQVKKNSKYCLVTQHQEHDGSIETQLYKGNVVPTSGGGAQVIFNDVETLKQFSPV